MNLRWSWHPETRDLFETLDPALWQSCGGDPVKVLGEVSAERLAALAKDRKFLRRLQDAVDDLQEYLDDPALVPVAGRRGAGEHRLLLRRVRHHRGAAAVLRRPGHPGR